MIYIYHKCIYMHIHIYTYIYTYIYIICVIYIRPIPGSEAASFRRRQPGMVWGTAR